MSSQEDKEASGFADSLHRIESKWQEFGSTVVPANAGPVQRNEMRLAFFGGAAAMFNLIMTASSLHQGAAVGVIADLEAELLQYAGKGMLKDLH